MNFDPYFVRPRQKIDLRNWEPDDTHAWKGSDKAVTELADLTAKLESLQEQLYCESKHRLLVVLQGMDTSGKDGVIRKVFEGVNPQGVRVASFKVPTPIELAHDYLWRVHSQTPGKGEMVIFNRSHYEDVLAVRVHNLVPENVWKKRYNQINEFERLLVEEGTTVLKFYLHISRDEQKERLLERIETPEKNWKFNPGDLEERKLWPEYMAAYEDVLNRTSTEWAPWYLVPADKKWFRNVLISSVIVETLKGFDMKYPTPEEDLAPYAARLRAGE
ncbi:polyphosphate:AMP phosphotransferase [Longilinea arvoryzae]|uniref:Polyphosphate:AMP phosphotransferase n=1 Tax=Longilinea arvoryzae TaxID=360412 RepID=A0A0S7BD51_9CHLR|nr:polyphosphate kinase 2 family protein [Longilinea arvoryzae]GAP13293.1 polyphosphate:AMP phosphotransferase [Longilinea arvoryzae]